jgi:hypothetical protein
MLSRCMFWYFAYVVHLLQTQILMQNSSHCAVRSLIGASLLNPYQSIVKSNLTVSSDVPNAGSSSDQHIILQCFMLVFRKLSYLAAPFEL